MKCKICGKQVEMKRHGRLCNLHYREYKREYCRRPEVKAKAREYKREYYQRPEVKAKKREYQREYHQRPKVKAKAKEYHRQQAIIQREMDKTYTTKEKEEAMLDLAVRLIRRGNDE